MPADDVISKSNPFNANVMLGSIEHIPVLQ